MKKISYAIVAMVVVLVSCQRSLLPPKIKEYSNNIGYLYIKPVDIDTNQISEQKTYVLEGNLADGSWALFTVKADILKKIMAIKWPENAPGSITLCGYGFTINDLGKDSYLSRNDLKSNRFDKKQLEMLERNRKARKYDLVSALPYPAAGKMQDQKIVLQPDVSCTAAKVF
jgi:hypothetical protein